MLDAVAAGSPTWSYEAYVDAGHAESNRNPPDNKWRSKSTTSVLNQPELHLAMANVRKTPTTGSRWGVEFGLQTGEDSKNLVPSPPPAAKSPVRNADDLRHLYRANLSWLFGDDRGARRFKTAAVTRVHSRHRQSELHAWIHQRLRAVLFDGRRGVLERR